MTQNERILAHLRENGSITQLEAVKEFGITRLSGRIYDLKAEGYKIFVKRETAKNRYGESTSYARYYLEEKDAV